MNLQLSASFKPGMKVFVPTMSNESALLKQELSAHPERALGVDFCAIQFPGIDEANYISIHPEARQSSYFMNAALRAGMLESRAQLFSFDYPGIVHDLLFGSPMDLVIAHLTPPDAEGWCFPGLACDFLPLVWHRAKRRIAHLNPLMPKIPSSFRVHLSELDEHVEFASPLLDFKDPSSGEIEKTIGALIAPLVADGSTLQFGIGSIPLGLAHALSQHRHLKFHGGLLSSAIQTLWNAGAMDRDARMTTGVVLGDSKLREFAHELPSLWLTDVSHTHDVNVLKTLEGLTAINGAIEVDLFGQVNSERSDGSLQAGPGGLPAFARGALAAPKGRLIICLPATAKKRTVSRIVPSLGARSICTLPRYLADTVVTEHGVAEIKNLSTDARAEALIQIAAPEHQQALVEAWAEMREQL
jgi:acyl-CoA hydrolase